ANAYAQMKYGKGFSADAKKMYEAATQIASDVVGSIRTVASIRGKGFSADAKKDVWTETIVTFVGV
ncbi:ABC transporter B family member 11-like protein, partial [Tanacetum coccineum]